MATKVAAAGGGNWTVGATWVGGSAPTAADDAVLQASSGNVTIDSGAVCRSLDCTSGTGTYAGTLTHTAGVTLSIGDGTAGAGNVAFKLTAGMTYTLGNAISSALSFVTTSTTQQTFTTGGKNIGQVSFGNAGSSFLVMDSFTVPSGSVSLISGTLNTNGQTCSWAFFSSSNSNVRTLTLGASAITITGTGTAWNNVTSTNLTMTANTAVVTFTNTGVVTFQFGAINHNGMSVVVSAVSNSGYFISGASGATFQNFTITGQAIKTALVQVFINFTVAGTLTVTSNSDINRLLLQSGTVGTARTITAATVVISNTVDFMDIVGAGAATWTVAGTGATALGDAGGNSGITFTTPATQTHTTSAGGNWSDATKWTSRVPLPQDNVIVDGNTTGTLTIDMPRFGANITLTGFAGTFANSLAITMYGNLTLASGLTFSGFNAQLTLGGRGAHTVTSAGKTIPAPVVFSGPGGTYTIQDALTVFTGLVLTFNDGTFNANNFNVTAGLVAAGSGRTTVINMGSGTWALTGTSSNVWSVQGALTTVNPGTSTLVISTASTLTRNIITGTLSRNLYTLTYTVANSPGVLAVTSLLNVTNLNVGSGRILSLASSVTHTIAPGGTFNVNGAVNGYVRLPGVAANYISALDSAALSITGDIDIRVKTTMDDWTPAGATVLIAKWVASGNQRSWYLRNDGATGLLRLGISPDGIAPSNSVASSVAPTVSDGAVLWVRVTWRQSDGRVQFFTSNDGSAWTQLGTNQTIAVASIFDSAAAVEIGSADTGTAASFFLLPGNFYRAQIRNNILDDGTGIVFDADFTTKPVGANSFTESSTNAAMVTINGTLAQAGDGRVGLVSSTPGTAAILTKPTGTVSVDYLTIQDSTAGVGWYAGANSVNVSNNKGWIFTAAPSNQGNFFPLM